MKLSLVFILILVTLGSRCSDKHICEGEYSCCKGDNDKWGCCIFAAGVCCSNSRCCAPGWACSSDGSECLEDPYGFLAEVGYSTQIIESQETLSGSHSSRKSY